ncbi:MAG: hypothetical protein ACR2Q3_11645 [Woeseiaceae bacterium]
MGMWIGIFVVVALIGGYVILRNRRARENVRPDQLKGSSQTPDSAFHAVSLQFAGNACDAAKSMRGRRFLSGAAPRIPLLDCDAVECQCKFVHHKDRRTSGDRRSPFATRGGGGEIGDRQFDQRHSSERRLDPDDNIDDF